MRQGVASIILLLMLASAAHAEPATKHRPRPMRVTATAYCQAGRTQSGVRAHTGVLAADPRVLPVGSIVRILDGPTTGIYTVMDTGSGIKGRRIDVYMPNCARAKRFGRRTISVIVMRHGWDATTGDR